MDISNKFTAGGQEWVIDLRGLADLRRVEAVSGIPMIQLCPEMPPKAKDAEQAIQPLLKRMDDRNWLFSVVWAAVSPVAEKRGVTQDQFAEKLDGPATDAAEWAFLKAIYDFFRWNSRRQMTIRAIREYAMKAIPREQARIEQAMKKVDFGKHLDALPEIDVDKLNEQIAESIRDMSSNSWPTGLEEEPASTPSVIPSDS